MIALKATGPTTPPSTLLSCLNPLILPAFCTLTSRPAAVKGTLAIVPPILPRERITARITREVGPPSMERREPAVRIIPAATIKRYPTRGMNFPTSGAARTCTSAPGVSNAPAWLGLAIIDGLVWA